MNIVYAGICETGLKRETNQDRIVMLQNDVAGLFAVADGMGGHSRGEVASGMIASTLESWWEHFSPQVYGCDMRNILYSIQLALEEANLKICRQYNQGSVCGSTMAVLFLYQGQYGILYAGDSRIYVRRHLSFQQLTVDEVWENQPCLCRAERRDKNHPNKGKLVNAFGVNETLRLRAMTDGLQGRSAFLLCSDGLYKLCPERQIRQSMERARRSRNVQGEVLRLLQIVYGNKAPDNVSIVLVGVE